MKFELCVCVCVGHDPIFGILGGAVFIAVVIFVSRR